MDVTVDAPRGIRVYTSTSDSEAEVFAWPDYNGAWSVSRYVPRRKYLFGPRKSEEQYRREIEEATKFVVDEVEWRNTHVRNEHEEFMRVVQTGLRRLGVNIPWHRLVKRQESGE
jgi:hypothetical protein